MVGDRAKIEDKLEALGAGEVVRLDVEGRPVEIVTTGRHDPCVGLRAVPIVEAMLLVVMMDHYLRHRAQCADVVTATPVITR